MTIQYVGVASAVTTTPKFIQANLRGSTEWFAVVNQSMKTAISNYASGTDGPFRRDSADPATVVTWNNIVTTLITDMSYLFYNKQTFNQPIASWDTRAVTTMAYTFATAYAFNQPIATWNTSTVADMNTMFANAREFNQPIATWNTSNVTDMGNMFFGARAFNQPIAFNQTNNTWNTIKVLTMGGMFSNAIVFNQDISNWNLNLHPNVYFFSFSSNSALTTENKPLRFR